MLAALLPSALIRPATHDRLRDELQRQAQALRQEARIRLIAVTWGYAVTSLFLPFWIILSAATVHAAAELVMARLFADIEAMVRDRWRRVLSTASVVAVEIAFISQAAVLWNVDAAMSKPLAVGLVTGATMHLASVRAIHLPHGLAGAAAVWVIVIAANTVYWVQRGLWPELALATVCIAMSLGHVTMSMLANHRLHREGAAARHEAQRANETRGRFLAQMSHELRTPLNGIMGMADAELRSSSDPASRARLAVLAASAQGLSAILDDVLDLSAIQAGRLAIRPLAMVPGDAVASAAALFRPAAEEAGMALAIEIDPGLSRPAMVDGQRLRQCLSNLLSNAIRHGQGATRISVVAAALAGPDGTPLLAIEVEDDGPGVPEPVQSALLLSPEVMAQGNTLPELGAGPRGAGHGLGLSIARGLALQMGGDVRLLPTRGASFGARFLLTVAMPPAAVQPQPVPPPDNGAQSLRGLRVLVVDDVATNRLVALSYLRHLGAAACETSSGEEALARLAVEHVDLVLLDMNMPGLDGLETFRRLRALPPPFGRVAVIALTADALDDQRARLLAQGVDGYLAKPVTPDRIAAEILRVLGQRLRAIA